MTYDWKICTVVNHGLGEKIAAKTRIAGARGGTILVGRGELESPLLRFLSLAEIERDVLVTLVTNEQLPAILAAIAGADIYRKKNEGCAFVLPTGGNSMDSKNTHELITIIVNRGYADDIMNAARKAGAPGGTILNARGTGKPDDEKFFGVTIVPEKEQLLILAEKSASRAIQDAIAALPCLTTPGIGIMYTQEASNFVTLGKKRRD